MTRPESDTSLERAFVALVAHRHASEAENNTPNSVTMCEKAENPDDATNAPIENGLSQTGSSTLGGWSANQDRGGGGDVSLDTPTPQIPRPTDEPSQAPAGAGPALGAGNSNAGTSGADDSMLARIGSMLARQSASIDSIERGENSNAGTSGADDLRIETWARTNKDGTITRFWQWASRKKKAGKQGGKKWRSYGGTIDRNDNFTESTGKRGGARTRTRRHERFT